MRTTFSRLLLLAFLTAGVPGATFAASPEILLVFSANSEINRHLYSLLGNTLGSNGYHVTATLQPGSVTPGKYKAVVVFSTRVSGGLEPSLEAFVKGYPAPAELYLVSLVSGSSDLTVSKLTKAQSLPGIDGITAATQWSQASQPMHAEWVHLLVRALKAR